MDLISTKNSSTLTIRKISRFIRSDRSIHMPKLASRLSLMALFNETRREKKFDSSHILQMKKSNTQRGFAKDSNRKFVGLTCCAATMVRGVKSLTSTDGVLSRATIPTMTGPPKFCLESVIRYGHRQDVLFTPALSPSRAANHLRGFLRRT